jgi:hypothetical protein
VTAYESGEPVDNPPPGIDIHTASLSADLHVALESGQNPPAELAGWAADDEMLLWMTLYEAIPDPPETYVEWLFALDLDGDAETGRPQGSARINPDLGMEAAIGAYYNPSAAAPYGAFLWIWDPDLQGLVPKHGPVRFTFGDSRALVGLAIPLASFTDMVANTAGVTIVPENVKGRAAALHGTEGSRTIDFYPDRPGS